MSRQFTPSSVERRRAFSKRALVAIAAMDIAAGTACLWSVWLADFRESESDESVRFRSEMAQYRASTRSLAELLTLPNDRLQGLDVGLINLLCAEGLRGSEELDVNECLHTLDEWAHHVEAETKRNLHRFQERPQQFNNSLAYYQMGMLGTVLAEDMRIEYNREQEQRLPSEASDVDRSRKWNAFFSNSKNVFVHGLLSDKHQGTCTSMPFLYVAIGRRLGYPVTIASRKHHLYVRYELASGEHLNIEATANGFVTPTDEEYSSGPFPMTDNEIEQCGWMRPLSNKEILGICLFTRAGCLRSMKRYDEEILTLNAAARYVPHTPMMRRIIQRNQELSKELRARDLSNGAPAYLAKTQLTPANTLPP